MKNMFVIALLSLLAAGCVGSDRQTPMTDNLGTPQDTATDPVEWHRERTKRLADINSLYQRYLIASENAEFFASMKMPLELGHNLDALGSVMSLMHDSVRAMDYHNRAADCYRQVNATEDLIRNEVYRSNTVNRNGQQPIYQRLLTDSNVNKSPDLRALALERAYLSTYHIPYLDSFLTLVDSIPSINRRDLPMMLAMRAQEALAAGDLDDAISRIPRIKTETAALHPIPQHREFIHIAVAQIYDQAGMKDSCIAELLKTILYTDSSTHQARLPEIYAGETRKLIDLTEHNATLEKRSIMLWWAISALILLTIAAWALFWAKRRQSTAQQEIELLDSRMESLMQSQTAQAAVMEENRRLIDDIDGAINNRPTTSATQLTDDIRRILSLYSSREENRQGFLTVSRQIDPRFTTRLKTDFPNLSEGQLRLAALIAAGVDSSQLATILNISSKSLYTSRYRLRTGLKLSKTDSLEEFLRGYASTPPSPKRK